jgi:hypothetical protein
MHAVHTKRGAYLLTVLALLSIVLSHQRAVAQPTNDNFANRIQLSGLPVTTAPVSVVGATLEPGEPRLPAFTVGQTVWWTWTAPMSGMVAIDPIGSMEFPAVSVYTGDELTNLTRVAGLVINPGGVLPFQVQAATTYQIQADAGATTYLDGLQLELVQGSVPTNDFFTNAIPLDGTNVTLSGDNTFAGSEPGEPQHVANGVGKSLWFTWTAPAQGVIELSGGGWWEAAVYTGDTLTNLQKLGVSANTTHQPLWLTVQQGVLYHIAVDSINPNWGPFTMSLQLTPTPTNDFFANRAVLPPTTTNFNIDLGGAGREPGEPMLKPDHSTNGRTLWWTFIAPSKGTLKLSGGAVNAYEYLDFGVFSGTNLTSLKPISESNLSVVIPVQPGKPYQIVVDSASTYDPWGSRIQVININSEFDGVPSNDNFAGRIALVGPSVTTTNNNIGATRESGEPRFQKVPTMGATTWFTWTAPDAGWVYLSSSSEFFTPAIGVFQGSSVSNLRRVTASVYNPDSGTAVVGFNTVAGQTYQIAVDGISVEGNHEGEFWLDLEFTTLQLISPTNGLVCDSTSPPAFSINTPDPAVDGQLTSVTFLVENNDLGQQFGPVLSAPPFTATPTNLAPGLYVAFALATNDSGRTLLSPPVTFVARPPGDDFNQPVVLTNYDWQYSGTVDGASLQRGEPAHSGNHVDGSVWLQWTAPASGPVDLATSFPESIHLEVFAGTNLANLKRINKFTNATAGVTYDFAVCHRPMPPGEDSHGFSVNLALRTVFVTSPSSNAVFTDLSTVPFRISTSEPSSNILQLTYLMDGNPIGTNNAPPYSFDTTGIRPGNHTVSADALLASGLESVSAVVPFNVVLANDHFTNAIVWTGFTNSSRAFLYGATTESGEPMWPQPSAWWVWTAPQSGRVWIDFNGIGGPWVMAFTGTSATTLANADFFVRSGMNISHIELNATSGVTYYIGLFGSTADGTLTLQFLQPPPNDNFANRTVVTGTNVILRSSLVEATEEPGEPVPPYGCGYTGRSVWWSWTAPANGGLSVSDGLAGPCVRISIFTGDVLTNLTLVNGPDVQGGQTYQIMFDNSEEINPLTATLTFTPAPANDYFTNRIHLTGTSFDVTTPILGTGLETNEPPHQDRFGSRSVWYDWTAPADGSVTFTSLSTFPMAIVDVYQGDSLDTLQSLNIGWNPQVFQAQAGVTYDIALGAFGFNYFEPDSFHFEFQPTAVAAPLSVVVPPTLHLALKGNELTLNWSAASSALLESSPDLIHWQPVTNTPAIEGDQQVISLTVGPGAQFFRLH